MGLRLRCVSIRSSDRPLLLIGGVTQRRGLLGCACLGPLARPRLAEYAPSSNCNTQTLVGLTASLKMKIHALPQQMLTGITYL